MAVSSLLCKLWRDNPVLSPYSTGADRWDIYRLTIKWLDGPLSLMNTDYQTAPVESFCDELCHLSKFHCHIFWKKLNNVLQEEKDKINNKQHRSDRKCLSAAEGQLLVLGRNVLWDKAPLQSLRWTSMHKICNCCKTHWNLLSSVFCQTGVHTRGSKFCHLFS